MSFFRRRSLQIDSYEAPNAVPVTPETESTSPTDQPDRRVPVPELLPGKLFPILRPTAIRLGFVSFFLAAAIDLLREEEEEKEGFVLFGCFCFCAPANPTVARACELKGCIGSVLKRGVNSRGGERHPNNQVKALTSHGNEDSSTYRWESFTRSWGLVTFRSILWWGAVAPCSDPPAVVQSRCPEFVGYSWHVCHYSSEVDRSRFIAVQRVVEEHEWPWWGGSETKLLQ